VRSAFVFIIHADRGCRRWGIWWSARASGAGESSAAAPAARHSRPRRAARTWRSRSFLASPRAQRLRAASGILGSTRTRLAVSRAPQREPHGIRGPAGGHAYASAPPSAVHVGRGCRPVRAFGEVRAHLATGERGAATSVRISSMDFGGGTSTG
jgi:hypothetical protein